MPIFTRVLYMTWILLMALIPAFIFAGKLTPGTDANYLNYIQNKGQWDHHVLYRSSFRGGNVFLEKTAFTYLFYPAEGVNKHNFTAKKKQQDSVLNFHAVHMEFDGALEEQPVITEEVQPFYHNYFMGTDSNRWAANVPLSKAVVYKNIYSGIDVKVFGRGNNVRYDFIVSPGASPSAIVLKFTGQQDLFLRDGQLIIGTCVGEISQTAPYAYQQKDGRTLRVVCNYSVTGNKVCLVVTGNYDKTLPLIIDPTLIFSTYTGSTSDNWGMSASFDQLGNAYTAGICFGPGYPTTPGAFQVNFGGGIWDISLSKFDPTGTSLLFSTYLGGSLTESPQSITVDNTNCLLVLGRTYSTDFPVISGCYDVTQNGSSDIVITKFNSTGTRLVASTFIGGTGNDGINCTDNEHILWSLKKNYADDGRGAVHVDENNNIYVASSTSSSDFPVTLHCFQPKLGGMQDGCVFKFNSSLSSLLFSSFLGGTSNDAAYNLAIDAQERLYVTGGTESSNFPTTANSIKPAYSGGIDGFITHLSTFGNAITESSYIGTASYDQSYFVQIDNQNNIYLYGQCSGDYPISAGVYSNGNSGQFIHKLDPTLSTTFFSTEFGSGRGTSDIVPSAFLVDKCENIYVAGWGGSLNGNNLSTSSTLGMPITPAASGWVQTTTDGNDFYFATLSQNAVSLLYGTFFGGGVSLEHVDGGTSCFDKSGMIYQAICASCDGKEDMPTYPSTVWSTSNKSNNCNNGLVKLRMDIYSTVAQADANAFMNSGCVPFSVNFLNLSTNAVSYIWYFGDGSSSTNPSPAYTYYTEGTYSVTLVATDMTTCNQRDTSVLVINVLPPALVVPQLTSAQICKGDSVSLGVNFTNANSYTWQPAGSLTRPNSANPIAWPPVSTVYTLNVNDSVCNSISTRTLLLTIETNTTAIIASQNELCYTDTLLLFAKGACQSYSWSTGQNSSSIKGHFLGLFSVSTTDLNGCKAIDSFFVKPRTVFPPTCDTICVGRTAQLFAPVGNYTYKWYPPDFLSGTTVYNPTASPPATGVYVLLLSTGTCVAAVNHSIVVSPSPTLSLGPQPIKLFPGESVQLFAKADTVCSWFPDNALSCTHCNTPVANPIESIVYYCYVVNSFGCSNTNTVVIEVMPVFYIPNTFTPNNDGLNDAFRPVFNGYTALQMTIFDRWGDLMYSTNELDGGWNGTYRGKPADQGTYVYKITATDFENNKLEKTGPIILVR